MVLGVLVLTASTAHAQPSLDERLESHVRYLASSDLEGRGNDTAGLRQARDYVVATMQRVGLEPAGSDGFVSPVEVITRAKASDDNYLKVGKRVLTQGVEFSASSYSDAGAFKAPAVFVGYGLSAPSVGYDDYAGRDVRGKVVVAMTGAPARHRRALRSDRRRYLLGTASKAAVALAHGARALLLVNDPRSYGDRSHQRVDKLPEFNPFVPLEGLGVARLTEQAGRRVLAAAGIDLPNVQRRIDQSGEPHSRALDVRVRGELAVERSRGTVYNCVGLLPGTEGVSGPPLVLSAHYDGLGYGHAGSLSKHTPALHPGADDNASGVALLLELARALAERAPEPRRPILFVAPAAEELALRGSRRLARELLERFEPGVLINMDMVGHLHQKQLHVGAPASDLQQMIEAQANDADLRLALESPTRRFTDHVAFAELGFQPIHITTGHHAHYHMPSDTPEELHWDGMVRVYKFVEGLVRRLATP